MIGQQESARIESRPLTAPANVQVIHRPRCPACQSKSIEVRSSRAQNNGTQLRYCRCRECGQSLKVIVD